MESSLLAVADSPLVEQLREVDFSEWSLTAQRELVEKLGSKIIAFEPWSIGKELGRAHRLFEDSPFPERRHAAWIERRRGLVHSLCCVRGSESAVSALNAFSDLDDAASLAALRRLGARLPPRVVTAAFEGLRCSPDDIALPGLRALEALTKPFEDENIADALEERVHASTLSAILRSQKRTSFHTELLPRPFLFSSPELDSLMSDLGPAAGAAWLPVVERGAFRAPWPFVAESIMAAAGRLSDDAATVFYDHVAAVADPHRFESARRWILDRDPDLRCAAVRTLFKAESPEADDLILGAVTDPALADIEFRRREDVVIAALRHGSASSDPRHVDFARSVLSGRRWGRDSVRAAAVPTLARMNEPEAVDLVISNFIGVRRHLSTKVAEALSRVELSRTVGKKLAEIVVNPRTISETRSLAAKALSGSSRKPNVEALISACHSNRLRNDISALCRVYDRLRSPDDAVRRIAISAFVPVKDTLPRRAISVSQTSGGKTEVARSAMMASIRDRICDLVLEGDLHDFRTTEHAIYRSCDRDLAVRLIERLPEDSPMWRVQRVVSTVRDIDDAQVRRLALGVVQRAAAGERIGILPRTIGAMLAKGGAETKKSLDLVTSANPSRFGEACTISAFAGGFDARARIALRETAAAGGRDFSEGKGAAIAALNLEDCRILAARPALLRWSDGYWTREEDQLAMLLRGVKEIDALNALPEREFGRRLVSIAKADSSVDCLRAARKRGSVLSDSKLKLCEELLDKEGSRFPNWPDLKRSSAKSWTKYQQLATAIAAITESPRGEIEERIHLKAQVLMNSSDRFVSVPPKGKFEWSRWHPELAVLRELIAPCDREDWVSCLEHRDQPLPWNFFKSIIESSPTTLNRWESLARAVAERDDPERFADCRKWTADPSSRIRRLALRMLRGSRFPEAMEISHDAAFDPSLATLNEKSSGQIVGEVFLNCTQAADARLLPLARSVLAKKSYSDATRCAAASAMTAIEPESAQVEVFAFHNTGGRSLDAGINLVLARCALLPHIEAALLHAFENDPRPSARQNAVEALGSNLSDRALESLLNARSEADRNVGRAIMKTLLAIYRHDNQVEISDPSADTDPQHDDDLD